MLHSDPLHQALLHALEQQGLAGLQRSRRVVERVDATRVQIDGHLYVDFSCNDYLGLSRHPSVLHALRSGPAGVGAVASGLISGHTPDHASAERTIAAWKGREAAILLPSGYQANLAAVQTIAAVAGHRGGGARFLIDKLAHASLVEAVRASGAPFRVFPHNNLHKLRRLLSDGDEAMQIVVTESIFSMDGDAADLAGLAELKRSHPFVLLLDEAHGSGVYGPGGAGYAAEGGWQDLADVTVVTLSKALGCAGGAICGSQALIDAVVNFGRAYIYSTATPAPLARAIQAAVGVLADEPWRQSRLRANAAWVRRALRRVLGRGAQGGGNAALADSPIIPVVLKTETAALEAAGRLLEAGIFVVAIRPPTVARGTSRLRLTVSCEHNDSQLDLLVNRVMEVCQA